MFIDNIVYLFSIIHSLHELFMYCYHLKYDIEVTKIVIEPILSHKQDIRN